MDGTHTPSSQDLAELFPVCVVCALDGRVLEAPQHADPRVLPPPEALAPWLRDLVVSAGIGDETRPGSPPVAVAAVAPNVDGVATVFARDDGVAVRILLRPLDAVPAMRIAARRLAMFEAILRTGPVFVHVQDGDFASRWSSSELRSELGYHRVLPGDREENLSYVHPDDVPRIVEGRERLLAGDPQVRRRFRVRAADGSWRWLLGSSVNLLGDDDVAGIVAHTLDVTEEVHREQEVAEARRRLEVVIDALDETVVVVRGAAIEFANAQTQQVFGLPAGEELAGRSVADATEAVSLLMADPAAYRALVEARLASAERAERFIARAADDRRLEHNLLRVEPEGEREPTRIWVIRDVTAREQEDERRRRLLELERSARQDAEEREAGLRELDRLKTEFVSNVSHELRTPLSALITYLDLLLDDPDEALAAGPRRVAESARRTAWRLTRLVSDLLVMGQLESRALAVQREPFDVRDVVEHAVAEVEAGMSGEAPVEVDVGDGPPLVSDRLRVAQVLENLLDNAVKYGPSDRPVRCSAHVVDGQWVMEVRDEGPGISRQDAARAFDPFFRGGSGSESQVPGSGLGLPICAHLAALLGGLVELEALADGGTVARLVLPAEAADA